MEEYKHFFSEIRKIKDKQDKQLLRGLNDYNILTSVLKETDEVRLHSGMIFSLLNPSGSHGQGSLFLELFLDSVLSDTPFKINPNRCSVYKEYKNIDLYITDGSKHIIIENKIYAQDQEEQIKRYIDIIYKENEIIKHTNVFVIYLSIDRVEPSKLSLGNYNIDNNHLKKDGESLSLYKSIHYNNQIYKWLAHCKHEVQNITNLNEAIKQYIEVVRMINGEHIENKLSLVDFISDNKDIYKVAVDVCKALPNVRKKIIDHFFKEVEATLNSKLSDDWVIKAHDSIPKKYNSTIDLYKRDWLSKNKLIFSFQFDENDYINGHFGVVRTTNEVDIEEIVQNKFSNDVEEFNLKTTQAWLDWAWFPDVNGSADFCEYIVNNSDFSDNIVVTIVSLINALEEETGLVSKINSHIETLD